MGATTAASDRAVFYPSLRALGLTGLFTAHITHLAHQCIPPRPLTSRSLRLWEGPPSPVEASHSTAAVGMGGKCSSAAALAAKPRASGDHAAPDPRGALVGFDASVPRQCACPPSLGLPDSCPACPLQPGRHTAAC
jgi:hypothetical protein